MAFLDSFGGELASGTGAVAATILAEGSTAAAVEGPVTGVAGAAEESLGSLIS